MRWLEFVDDGKAAAGTEGAAKRPSDRPSARPIEKVLAPRPKRGKPIPREE